MQSQCQNCGNTLESNQSGYGEASVLFFCKCGSSSKVYITRQFSGTIDVDSVKDGVLTGYINEFEIYFTARLIKVPVEAYSQSSPEHGSDVETFCLDKNSIGFDDDSGEAFKFTEQQIKQFNQEILEN